METQQVREATVPRPGRVERPCSRAATRVPGAVSMAIATAATLGGLYGALALAVHSG